MYSVIMEGKIVIILTYPDAARMINGIDYEGIMKMQRL